MATQSTGEVAPTTQAREPASAELTRPHRDVLAPPVNRLPPEILSEVFSYVHDESDNITHVVKISHVCVWWREIALDTPRLWTTFTLDHPDVVTACLERSGAMSLKLSLTKPRYPLGQIARLIAPALPRVRVLCLHRPGGHDLQSFIDNITASSASILEELEIEYPQGHVPLVGITGSMQPVIPLLPSGLVSSPVLRRLSIQNVTFLPEHAVTHVLVCLHIERNYTDPTPDVRTLREFLKQCPLLEELHVVGTIQDPEPMRSAERPRDVIHLPHLRRLRLYCNRVYMTGLLRGLKWPRDGTTVVTLRSV
ncbi:hypothetical protein C2E23DRAFT_288006 [Lenzites betulinus]|nr:hypothetical protein C2E23DRAFT_288006 [Lenzites betulinus]